MEEYRRSKSTYTTDGVDDPIFGTAIIKIDEFLMSMHYEDPIGRSEEWRGECTNGEYQLVKVDIDGRATGGSAKLKRIGNRLLAGSWATDGYAGEWSIVLQ
jgi:hypothetical protein